MCYITFISHKYISWSFPKNTSILQIICKYFANNILSLNFNCLVLHSQLNYWYYPLGKITSSGHHEDVPKRRLIDVEVITTSRKLPLPTSSGRCNMTSRGRPNVTSWGRPHTVLYVTPRDVPYHRIEEVSYKSYEDVPIWTNI